MTTEPINHPPVQDIENDVDAPGNARSSRRGAFAATVGGVAAALLAACGRDPQESIVGSGGSTRAASAAPGNAPSATRPQTPGRQTQRQQAPAVAAATPAPRQDAPPEGDLAIGAVAASLEQLAVNTYAAALDAATSGALGDVPPAVAEFVTTALAHHQAYLDAWNGVLTSAGGQAVTTPPPELEQSVNEQFGMVTDVGGAAELALTLEQVAGATYTAVLNDLESTAAIDLAGSIQSVTRQRVAILLFVLGMYPVPETFVSVDMAFTGEPMTMPTPMVPTTG